MNGPDITPLQIVVLGEHQLCDACETVAHCSRHGCIPLQQAADLDPAPDHWAVIEGIARRAAIRLALGCGAAVVLTLVLAASAGFFHS